MHERPSRSKPRQRGLARPLVLRALLVLAGGAVVWTILVGVWLPRFAPPRIEAAASAALGAPFSLGELKIAPWSLGVSVADLRLGPPEAAWLKVAQVEAQLSIESLWRLAPVLRRVSVRAPQLHLERLEAGRLNITPMLDALARRPAALPDSKPARFAVYNIRLEDGRIDFFDRVANQEHRVEALQIGVPFVSNLPSKLAVDVEPLLDARIDGSRLHLQGKTQPFNEGQRSSIAIDWQQLDLARWTQALAPLLPEPLPIQVAEGEGAGQLQIAFERRGGDAPPAVRITGGLQVDKLRAALPQQGAQVTWERFAVEGLDVEPFERRASVTAARLQAPEARIDLAKLLAPQSTPSESSMPAQAPSTTAPVPWQWQLGEMDVDDGRVLVRHATWPEAQTLAPIVLNLKGLDSRADAKPAVLSLRAQDARGGAVEASGRLSIAAGSAELAAQGKDLSLPEWLAPWQAELPVRLLEARSTFSATAEAGAGRWALREADVVLTGVRLVPIDASRGAPSGNQLAVGRIDLAGLQASSRTGESMKVSARSLRLDTLDLKAARRRDTTLAWLPQPLASAPTQKAQPSLPLRWRLDELRCTACAFGLVDESVQPVARLALSRSDLTLRRLSDDFGQPIAFDLAARTGSAGRIKLAGSVRPEPLQLKSRVDLTALDLRLLQPYLRPYVNLELATAKLGAAGDLLLEGAAATPVKLAQWRGRVALGELRALDALNQAELLRLKALQIEGADVAWHSDAPLQADLGTVKLQDFYGRVIVNADGRLNLLDIARREGQDGPRSLTTPQAAASAPAEAASASDATAATGRPQLRWRAIELAGGTIDFTDNFIRPNYSAKLSDLAGSVAALAWNDPQPAAVVLTGKVDGSAPLEISGSVHPLGARLATDITASTSGIDITRLTGYSGRYAGYGIEKGTLSVKVRYKIVDGKLEAENNLYLDQLTFGERVDSPDALKLPVLLAVSLLKDRNGVIDLNLPISGSLDDPKFSIGGVIVKVIVNLITKAVTAPFSLLARAFGGSGGEELGHVDFAAGSAELSDAARQKLDTLAKALNDRPALRLEATGHADAARDEAALRAQHVLHLMRAAKAKATGVLPESVSIDPAERPRWIETAYKAADLKDKPRNVLGLAKSLPPAEMEALLQRSAFIDEAALKTLADERGDRVKAYLVSRVAPQRVLLTASKLGAPRAAEGTPGAAASSVVFALK
jgi:hypothetical protein